MKIFSTSSAWSLGVVAYELLTGTLPFAGASGDWTRSILTGHFTPLDVHLSNPPEKWNAFFAHVFSTDPAQRPQSAAEFFAQLEHTFAG